MDMCIAAIQMEILAEKHISRASDFMADRQLGKAQKELGIAIGLREAVTLIGKVIRIESKKEDTSSEC